MGEASAHLAEVQRKLSFPFGLYLGREITVDEFFDKFYVEPRVSMTAAVQNQVFDWHSEAPRKIVIIGSMGAGKSTYLVHQFRQVIAQRGPQSAVLRDFQFFVDNEPILDDYLFQQSSKVIFVDSLDETALEQIGARFEAIITKLLKLTSVVIACRAPFFSELFGAALRADLDAVVQLAPYEASEQDRVITHFIHALETSPKQAPAASPSYSAHAGGSLAGVA